MTPEIGRALLAELEARRIRLGHRPTSPFEMLAQQGDPVPAVARRLADLLAPDLAGSSPPSERIAMRSRLETALLAIFDP